MTPTEIHDLVTTRIGRRDVTTCIVPPSRGTVADATTRGLGNAIGEASLPRSIRENLAHGKRYGSLAYVGGISKEKTEWALREALHHAADGELSGMRIYTNAPLTPALKSAAKHTGASLEALDLPMEQPRA